MAKKKVATFDELIADSTPAEKQVEVGGHVVTVRELSGKDRFELAALSEEELTRWDMLVWVCMRGMVDPKPNKPHYMEKLRPEWVVKIATTITEISGIGDESLEEAENESAGVTDIGGSSRGTSDAQSAKRKSA